MCIDIFNLISQHHEPYVAYYIYNNLIKQGLFRKNLKLFSFTKIFVCLPPIGIQ